MSETRVAFQSTYIFNSNVVIKQLLRLINHAYVLLRKPATLVAGSVDHKFSFHSWSRDHLQSYTAIDPEQLSSVIPQPATHLTSRSY